MDLWEAAGSLRCMAPFLRDAPWSELAGEAMLHAGMHAIQGGHFHATPNKKPDRAVFGGTAGLVGWARWRCPRVRIEVAEPCVFQEPPMGRGRQSGGTGPRRR